MVTAMKTVIEAIENAGMRDRVKVMVGGAPITEEYARSIGADGYGRDAVKPPSRPSSSSTRSVE
jgi:methanogenic corrinoid protein MtbC1